MTQPLQLAGKSVPRVGLGAMPLSWRGMLDERDRSIATVHAALDAGCRHVDTSNIYAPGWQQTGHNEVLVAEALASWSGPVAEVVVATKGGLVATADGIARDGSLDGLRAACDASLECLGVDSIDLYYLHRADPTIAFQSQVEHLAQLCDDGHIASIGLSNVSAEQLDVARAIAPIEAVQNEWSPRYRNDRDVLEACASNAIAYVAWSPFGGADRAHDMGSQYRAFAEVGEGHGCSAHRVALAWSLAQSDTTVPIPGSTRPETILDSFAALDLVLTTDELSMLDATIPEGTSQYPDDMDVGPLFAAGS